MNRLLHCCILLLLSQAAFPGKIALTFDDAPMQDSVVMSGAERTRLIIKGLKDNGVNEALFFVLAKNITSESEARINQYYAAGFELGNHSFSHQSANKTDAETFLVDSYRAHLTIKKYDPRARYFRFPYLHAGDTSAKRAEILDGLYAMGYRLGYVTVDNFDWYINSLYVQAVEVGKSVNLDNLGQLYVDVLWSNIQFYDQLALEFIGKSPKHVLLLHENDLAALFLPRLVKKLKNENWEIISPSEAYNERALRSRGDNFSFSKQGRVAAIAHALGAKKTQLRHVSENTEHLDDLFRKYKVFN